VPADRSGPLLERLADDHFLKSFLQPVGRPQSVNRADGVRIAPNGERTIHFRASGNAPELRCYAEAKTAEEAEKLVRWGFRAAAAAVQ
jgi:phosphomannomutase